MIITDLLKFCKSKFLVATFIKIINQVTNFIASQFDSQNIKHVANFLGWDKATAIFIKLEYTKRETIFNREKKKLSIVQLKNLLI